jgi:hypothetical protein
MMRKLLIFEENSNHKLIKELHLKNTLNLLQAFNAKLTRMMTAKQILKSN